jgi:hypothetical protein
LTSRSIYSLFWRGLITILLLYLYFDIVSPVSASDLRSASAYLRFGMSCRARRTETAGPCTADFIRTSSIHHSSSTVNRQSSIIQCLLAPHVSLLGISCSPLFLCTTRRNSPAPLPRTECCAAVIIRYAAAANQIPGGPYETFV